MTPQESRERFIESLFTIDEIIYLKSVGLYDDYVQGHISVNTIYNHLKDQAT